MFCTSFGLSTDHSFIVIAAYWVGATDLLVENEWVWMNSNRRISFRDWLPGEPNNDNGNGNCLVINYHHRWNDGECKSSIHYICEKEKEYVSIYLFAKKLWNADHPIYCSFRPHICDFCTLAFSSNCNTLDVMYDIQASQQTEILLLQLWHQSST